MALMKCSECGNDVSDKAPSCPKCGAPVVPGQSNAGVIQAQPVPAGETAAPTRPATTKKIRPLRLVLLLVLLGLVLVLYGRIAGQRLAPALLAPPQTLFSETIQLKEGEAKSYGFTLPSIRTVEVTVAAHPKRVNVMLMSEEDWRKYNKARGDLFGGKYTYRQTLSRREIVGMKERDMLPAGSWRIVIERPQEAILFGEDTTAVVTIIANPS